METVKLSEIEGKVKNVKIDALVKDARKNTPAKCTKKRKKKC